MRCSLLVSRRQQILHSETCATLACQVGRVCARLRRAVGKERCTRRSEQQCHAGASAGRERTFFVKTCGDVVLDSDLWRDAVGSLPPDLNLDAALREMLHSDDLYSVCAGTAAPSHSRCLTRQEISGAGP